MPWLAWLVYGGVGLSETDARREPGSKVRAVDLFCGVGGLSAGLMSAGIDVVAAYDNWPVAVDAYRRNLGDHAVPMNLLDVDECVRKVAELEPDLIAGGPPCQDFSTAGKRTEGKRANLTITFANIVVRCSPRLVLMENVPQVRRSVAYGRMLSMLDDRGYRFKDFVLDASRFGVPQLRKRLFLVGWLGDDSLGDRFSDWISDSAADNRLTVKDFFGDEIDIEYYYRHPRNYSRRAIFSVFEPSPTVRGVNRPVPPNYRRNHLDSAPPESVRALTSWERSRIQTFPQAWDWGDVKSDRNSGVELLIGNAVPVKLAESVGSGLLHAIAK